MKGGLVEKGKWMKKKRKIKIIIISCIAGAILLFFVTAVIYNAFFKEDDKGVGIDIIGEIRSYDISVVLSQ